VEILPPSGGRRRSRPLSGGPDPASAAGDPRRHQPDHPCALRGSEGAGGAALPQRPAADPRGGGRPPVADRRRAVQPAQYRFLERGARHARRPCDGGGQPGRGRAPPATARPPRRMVAAAARHRTGEPRAPLAARRARTAWLFLLPMLAILAAVAGWPLLRTAGFAFTDA